MTEPSNWEPVERPPLGIMPRTEFLRYRTLDILAAIDRYLRAGKPVPRAWGEELFCYLDGFEEKLDDRG